MEVLFPFLFNGLTFFFDSGPTSGVKATFYLDVHDVRTPVNITQGDVSNTLKAAVNNSLQPFQVDHSSINLIHLDVGRWKLFFEARLYV